MMEYLNWAVELEGVSPVARLLALWMANHATYIGSGPDAPTDIPVCEVDIDRALAWIGCEEGELLAATIELIEQGVSPLKIEGRKLRYTFPDLVRADGPQTRQTHHYELSIYVISLARDICKIGISKFPENRLAGLQASNPTQRLTLTWSAKGPSTKIRRAEHDAHKALAAHALGNEWFRVEPADAIEVVTALLVKAGVFK